MSQAKNEEEAQTLRQEGLEFYEALKGFFERNPRFLIWVLHSIADDIDEIARNAGNLTNDIYMLMGRIDTVQELFWQADHYDSIQKPLAQPEITRALMRALARLAKVYVMLKGADKDNDNNSDNVDTIALENLLEEANGNLYVALRAVIEHAEGKHESQNCQNTTS